ncbi:hypothetical protein ACHAXH_006056 [Discostella pseudostelligera]
MMSKFAFAAVIAMIASSASAFAPVSRPMRVTTTVFAEDADYEAQFKKLQQEAEDRLEEKVQELIKNVDNVGAK